ncbi:hypothetical protein DM01DRAFT_1380844 [Hesseltinella vesiculosa]|uniref:Sec39 domain-containing protein n=1 Tax=Hesseltinella vesiculosa TaxID=101127 RepID=A0A1X2GSP1_9FUNG|nr:hypothetical protein DM01DRAFT_1380844 [Hesseltinella vesiculosa]
MNKSTAQSDFFYHLQQGHYQSALDIGKDLDIDTDVVYKEQWQTRLGNSSAMDLTSADLALLDKINDDVFVVKYSLDLTLITFDLQQQLLQLGLARAQQRTSALDELQQNSSSPILSDADKTWLRARSYLLDYLDRLLTWNELHPASLDFYASFATFRHANLPSLAMDFARAENRQALDTLFLRHGQQLLPFRLAILSQIPETADPSGFDLPHVSGDKEDLWEQQPWRAEPDLVDQPWLQTALGLRPDPSTATPWPSTPYPASTTVIRNWYLDRARTIDRIGLPSHALALLRFAAAMGVPSLDQLIEKYDWLCKYVYTAARPEDALMQLDSFGHLSTFDVLDGFLTRTSATTIVQDMKRLVLPWLEYRSRCDTTQSQKPQEDDTDIENNNDDDDMERPQFLLYRWLLDSATSHLDWICAVLEASKPTLPQEDRVIKNDEDLSRVVLATVYASGDGASLTDLVRLFECLPIFSDAEANDEEEASVPDVGDLLSVGTPLGLFIALQRLDKAALTTLMDMLQVHLTSAEVLARYRVSVPLQWYLVDQPEPVQRQLCVRMASQAAGGVESGGEHFDQDDDWRELLDDMLRLHDDGRGIFGNVPALDIVEIFYTSLLRCGRFQLAKELLGGPRPLIDQQKAEQLVIEAEQEFFDNSMTGNMKSGDMKKAWDCLHVLTPPTPTIQKEMDLIEATHMLISVYQISDRPGMRMMPIQLRQSTNRLDLISKLVNTRKGIYRQFKEVVQMTSKLGYQDDPLAEVTVLAMMAGAAMVDEEYGTCYRLCQNAIDKAQSVVTSKQHPQAYVDQVHQAAWQICFNLGKLQAYDDPWRRLDALAMALTVCPVEYTHDILDVYQSLSAAHPIDQCDPALILQLESGRSGDPLADVTQPKTHASWHGLLQSTKMGQSMLGGFIKGAADPHAPTSPESSHAFLDHPAAPGTRKRDQLRQIVGGVGDWLFHQP